MRQTLPYLGTPAVPKTLTTDNQVLRCQLDHDEDGELVVHVGGQELELAEFGRMLRTCAAWGMHITFSPEDRLADEPEIGVR